MRVGTLYSFSWTSTSVLLLNSYLMNVNQNASMKTIKPSTFSLSSFFEINTFPMSEH